MEDPIAEKLTDIIRAQIPDDRPKSFTLDNRLDALGIDSLALYQIIFEIEDEFGIEIPDPESLEADAGQFGTITQLVVAVKEIIAQTKQTES